MRSLAAENKPLAAMNNRRMRPRAISRWLRTHAADRFESTAKVTEMKKIALAFFAVVAPASAYAASNECDPNYDPCVPVASDVDCASGNGNGPVYVQGPVRVIGVDIYGLDRDGDGIACEPRH